MPRYGGGTIITVVEPSVEQGGSRLHWSIWTSSPTQTRPPNRGRGLAHDRPRLRTALLPQLDEHSDHADHTAQPPCTATIHNAVSILLGSRHDAARSALGTYRSIADTHLSTDICRPRRSSTANRLHAAAAAYWLPIDRTHRQTTDGRTAKSYTAVCFNYFLRMAIFKHRYFTR